MKKLICLCLFAIVGSVVAFAEAAIDSSRFPDADTVIVDSLEDIRYNPDGTYVKTEDVWTKILTERGRRAESVVTLEYSKRYGSAAISGVWIKGEDGSERPIDVSATTSESTDNSAMGSNIYDPLDRRIVCAVPGLKVGDTLHVRQERRTFAARCQDQWADISVLEWTSPILRSSIVIHAPAQRPLKRIALRNPIGNVVYEAVTNADGSAVHSWTASDSPQVFPEPSMPTLHTQTQGLLVSTAENWQEISKWYWGLCSPHLAKTSAEMTNEVRRLGRDLRSIYRFVAHEVRYMGLTMEDTSPGYAPHDVDVTFANRYGVCRDKAALLVAMLRIAGFEAYPVLISAGSARLDEEVPHPYFNHAIVAVAEGDGYVLMDPTDENSRDLLPSYLGDCSYLVARPEGERLLVSPIVPASDNALVVRGHGKLERDGSVFAEYGLVCSGINDTMFRHHLIRLLPEERRRFFESALQGVAPGAELLKCEIEPAELSDTGRRLEIRLAARCPGAVVAGESRDEVSVPILTSSLSAANWLLEGNTALVKRRFPLTLDVTASVDEEFSLDLGDAVGTVAALPEKVEFEGKYSCFLRYGETNRVLTLSRRLAVNALEFSPSEYLELRERIKEVEAAERKRPVFARDPLSGADSRVILHRVECTTNGDYDWVTTNTVVREILTYAGKKGYSELKFDFVPSWKTVTLLEATVSNRDGRVSRVSGHEINMMDSRWVASAPRYPAGRKMVVSLPSVEIGSVISYRYVTEVKGSPLPFRGTWYFDSFVPTDRIEVRIDGFSRVAMPVRRLADEEALPDGWRYRDQVTIAKGDYGSAAARLRPLVKVEPLAPTAEMLSLSDDPVDAIRTWMHRNVRCDGPSLYAIPLSDQITPPEVVLRERYGTRLDYMRTLVALLKGAGYDADVVFASDDAKSDPESVRRQLEDYPSPGRFDLAFARVKVREGGLFGFGGREKTFYIGREEWQTPLGATACTDGHYLDPENGEIGLIDTPEPALADDELTELTITIRENGSADVDYFRTIWGTDVGSFRKRYDEMVPEYRERHFQKLLGSIAESATATRELETDTKSYPATVKFSAYVSDYAVRQDDALSFEVPVFSTPLFPLEGTRRTLPIRVASRDRGLERVVVVFPEGFDRIEHLPESYSLKLPGEDAPFCDFICRTEKDSSGRLRVILERTFVSSPSKFLSGDYFPLLKDWSRRASSRDNRSIVIRKF